MPSTVLPYPSLPTFVNYCLTPIFSKRAIQSAIITNCALGLVWKASELLFPITAPQIQLICFTTALIISIATVAKGIFLRFQAEEEAEKLVKIAEETVSDPKTEFENTKKAAKFGDANAQFRVGKYYQFGLDQVKENYEKAFKYYNLAATQGHIEAEFAVGNAYKFGHGVPKNLEKAFEYYNRAANQGSDKALYKIADQYFNEKDYIKAYVYGKLAKKRGSNEVDYLIERAKDQVRDVKNPESIIHELDNLKQELKKSNKAVIIQELDELRNRLEGNVQKKKDASLAKAKAQELEIEQRMIEYCKAKAQILEKEQEMIKYNESLANSTEIVEEPMGEFEKSGQEEDKNLPETAPESLELLAQEKHD